MEVGRYVLGPLLGRGGMARVYRARDTRLGRSVAVKLLAPELAHDPVVRRRFLTEARAAAGLNHPGIVIVHDHDEVDVAGEPVVYLVMELIEGHTLAQLLADRGPLSAEEALPTVRAVLAALDHAHRHGVVHRDIKPANVMVRADGGLKVTDFGIARITGADTGRLTATGTLLGTVAYMAPEVIRGGEAGPYSDVYAVGCLLYELLTGRLPYPGANAAAILYGHLNAPVPTVTDADPRPSPELAELVATAMAKEVADRYPDAGSMLEAAMDLGRPAGDRPSPRPRAPGEVRGAPTKDEARTAADTDETADPRTPGEAGTRTTGMLPGPRSRDDTPRVRPADETAETPTAGEAPGQRPTAGTPDPSAPDEAPDVPATDEAAGIRPVGGTPGPHPGAPPVPDERPEAPVPPWLRHTATKTGFAVVVVLSLVVGLILALHNRGSGGGGTPGRETPGGAATGSESDRPTPGGRSSPNAQGSAGPSSHDPRVRSGVFLPDSPVFRAATARGRLVVGVAEDVPQIGFRDEVNGSYSGFDIEMAKIVAAYLGFGADRIQFRTVAPAERVNAVLQGRVDYYVDLFTITDERRERVGFAGPYLSGGQGVLARTDNLTLTGFDSSLAHANVCSVIGSTPYLKLRHDFPQAGALALDTYGQCVDALLARRVDAVTTDQVRLQSYVTSHPGQLRIVGVSVTAEKYGIAVPLTDPALRGAVNDALQDAFATGTWKSAYERTLGIGGTPAPPPPALER
ncbi:protein kinase domain-containing protein [Embleya hyalina]|uniref:non-specific serine/threonine protein kinase n=1 Tax=Embleya hyalina TaxID=516124 RepID=A0A401YK88_9ACTN|nr:transporter substrate-binding domain-containing protein [Embleya hyalina]GCD95024.1 serine/threonine protein kinase [Embleya hyalina]